MMKDGQTEWPSGSIVAPLGASIGFVALYFVGEVPRVRRDVWARVLPFLSGYFDRSIPPEDNVSLAACRDIVSGANSPVFPQPF